jgi:hypothetical protein
LANWLADEIDFPSPDAGDRSDLAKVASFYESTNDRDMLRQRLRQVFGRKFTPGAIHRFLPRLDRPQLLVTTNYDDLIEQAFQDAGRPFHLVVHPSDQKEYAASVLWWTPGADRPVAYTPSELPLSLTDTSIIYKMHGTVSRSSEQWDTFVITEEDYMDFLSRMTGQTAIPARFMLEFRRRRFLFLGYSLADWNLRVVLRNLRTRLPGQQRLTAEVRPGGSSDASAAAVITAEPMLNESRRSWAVQRAPSNLESWLWEKRAVTIYDMNIEDFVARLEEQQTVQS